MQFLTVVTKLKDCSKLHAVI